MNLKFPNFGGLHKPMDKKQHYHDPPSFSAGLTVLDEPNNLK